MNVRHLATKFKTQFDAKNSNAATWALTHATQIADDISQTSKDNIALAVARAQEEGDLQEQYDEILDAVGDEARASLIARTESMTAVNEGQRDAWDQALEKGLLTEDNRVVWIATSDACPECEELDGEERTLDGEYPGDGGDGPPLHPNCRCTEGIVG
jgi:SPP1 gp7 family putative phage head morphogenesis protein